MKEPPDIPTALNLDPGHRQRQSDRAEILRRGLARSSVGNDVIRDLLSIVEGVHPGALNSAGVHKDILAAVIWLDESIAVGGVEPLHGSRRHRSIFQNGCPTT
jgi:hypothetical protein